MRTTSMMFRNRSSCLFFLVAVIFLSGWAHPALSQTDATQPAETNATPLENNAENPEKVSPVPEPATPPQAEKKLPPPSNSAEKWIERYEKLIAGLNDLSLKRQEADDFYQEIDTTFKKKRQHLRSMLKDLADKPAPDPTADLQKTSSDSPVQTADSAGEAPQNKGQDSTEETSGRNLEAVEQTSADLAVLYRLRIDVLPFVSPSLRHTATGTGIQGVRAFKEEVDYLLLMARIRLLLLPEEGSQSLKSIKSAPVPILLVFLQLFFACFVFYWWRRWAKKGLPNLRTNILGIKPRRVIHSWSAKLMWYLNRVRSPLEWWFLISALLGIVRTARGRVVLDLLWTNARLILIAWFVVLLVDAMSTRGAAGLRSDTAKLRLRSFWLIAFWGLVVGLGLGITEDIAGMGTIYAWVWILAKVLALPVILLLIRWWRPEIYRKLEEIQQPKAFVQKICQNRTGFSGFFGSVLGAGYLMVNGLRRLLLRIVTTFEGGRHFIANLTRLEAIRASEREPQKIEGDPISDDIRDLFFADDGGTVESVGQNTLKEMESLVAKNRKGLAAIVVEHGGGKSFLLRRLAEQFDGQVLILDCPPGGFGAFKSTFAGALGVDPEGMTPAVICRTLQEKSIRIVAIDNINRLSRPAFGGQKDMDRLATFYRALEDQVFWFLTLDWAAWQYISRVRDSHLFLDKIIRMPLWSEDQIHELIDLRTAHAGIEPDFGELVLPRQFEDDEHETLEERNRFGFFRILWNASDGNPVASLHMWAHSLKVGPEGVVRVALPQLPEAGELDKAGMTVLLTLRVIAQSGMASQEKIVDSLRLPAEEIAGALSLAHNHQWVEMEGNHYRLSWKWFRSIMRILSRQNLLVRRS